MNKFLFVVPPFQGHINPTLALGNELLNRGHQVAWIGFEYILKDSLPPGGIFIPVPDNNGQELNIEFERVKTIHGLKSVKYLFEDILVPLAHCMYTSIQTALDLFKPDLMICDQQTWAGFLVALNNRIPYITSCTTSAALVKPFDEFSKVYDWRNNIVINLQKHYGIEQERSLENSSLLTLVFSTETLVGDIHSFPKSYKFVGPAIHNRKWTNTHSFPWEKFKASKKKKIYFSFGTLNQEQGEKIFQWVYSLFKESEYFIVCSAKKEFFPTIPDNFIVQDYIPQLEILPYVDLVFTHAGHNTVCETLSYGKPLVVCPIKDDQSIIAHQCVIAGVAERVKFKRLNPDILLNAIDKVIQDKKYRDNARHIQKSFEEAGGAGKAAELILQHCNP